jgi:HK97 family phage major capsid protein
VDVYGRIVQHMVETSSLMRAGATVVTTDTGEDLVVPRSTGFVTSAITAEGAQITESDPTLSTVTLKAFKYANYFEISQELANDTPTNLLDFLARQAALSLGLGANGYGDDLINGAGTTEPRGLLLDAATGVTGPTGTGTTLGTQGTVSQGTDALWNLIGSVAEPYAESDSAAFLMRNASNVTVRKLRDTSGQPVNGLTDRRSILGYPCTWTRSCRPWRTPPRALPSAPWTVTSSGSSTASGSSAAMSSASRTISSPSAASCVSTAPSSTPTPSRPS